jgi:hypothetical protein
MASPPKFLHVGFVDQTVDPKTLEQTFSLGLDWLRYAPNCWLVYTTGSPEKWYQRIKKALPEPKDSHQFLICEVNLGERQGWLMPWIWEWIQKDRSSKG